MRRLIRRVITLVLATLLCLTPITALVVLGWLTRKTAADVQSRLAVQPIDDWPRLFRAPPEIRTGWTKLFAGFFANLKAGIGALSVVLVVTLPFALTWQAGWIAGWENSFSKGYELAGLWPGVSIVAVVLAVPIFLFLPMLVVHHAVAGTVQAAVEWRRILSLVRSAGWRYVALTVGVALGWVGTFGVRALPVFAEQMSERVAEATPAGIQSYAFEFKLVATALLVVTLVAMRHFMVRTYVYAIRREATHRPTALGTVAVLGLIVPIWGFLVFLLFLAQFLNYGWTTWLNQPILMLPWFGILPPSELEP
ncbi:MAG: hypothetical protein AAF493_15450 [Pseudomonadota bacterium]